jgi:hypothetical protein
VEEEDSDDEEEDNHNNNCSDYGDQEYNNPDRSRSLPVASFAARLKAFCVDAQNAFEEVREEIGALYQNRNFLVLLFAFSCGLGTTSHYVIPSSTIIYMMLYPAALSSI